MSHLLRHFDSEKTESALQNLRSQIAQCQTRAAPPLFRFQDRAGFVKCVEAVCQLEQIICQDVWTKTVQRMWNKLGELTQPFGEIDLGQFGEAKWHWLPANLLIGRMPMPRFACFAKDGSNPDIRVLQIRRGVSMKCEHLVPGTNVIDHPA